MDFDMRAVVRAAGYADPYVINPVALEDLENRTDDVDLAKAIVHGVNEELGRFRTDPKRRTMHTQCTR